MVVNLFLPFTKKNKTPKQRQQQKTNPDPYILLLPVKLISSVETRVLIRIAEQSAE